MLRVTRFLLILLCLSHPGKVFANNTEQYRVIGELSKMYLASMKVIFHQQPLINQIGGDKSALFGKSFIGKVKSAYKTLFDKPFTDANHRISTMMERVMIEVMEDNKTLLNDPDIAYKGFIPAIFAFQLSAKLSTKGQGVKIKFTSSKDMVRNMLNLPDLWETLAIGKVRTYQLDEYFDDKAVFDGKPAYRYFVPLKLEKFCLNCHGTPKDNPLKAHKDKNLWTNIDVTGFTMENWRLGGFGGGVSVTIYEQDQ